MGNQDTDTARVRLQLLQEEFTTPRARGPRPGPAARPAAPMPPIDLGILDHIASSIREIVDHTRTAVPAAPPPPAEESAVYQWALDQTQHLAAEQQRVRDAIVLRQSWEHALAMGEESVIRREPCPACRCWSLFWRPADRRAACVNLRCTDDRGLPHRWTLAQLAETAVAARRNRSAAAT